VLIFDETLSDMFYLLSHNQTVEYKVNLTELIAVTVEYQLFSYDIQQKAMLIH